MRIIFLLILIIFGITGRTMEIQPIAHGQPIFKRIMKEEKKEKNKKRLHKYVKIASTGLLSIVLLSLYCKYRNDVKKARDYSKSRKLFRLVLFLPDNSWTPIVSVNPDLQQLKNEIIEKK